MANVRIAEAARNAMMNTLDDQCNAGTAMVIQIYDGTQPATADTAITTQTLLATLTASATAFGAASGGVLTLNSVTDDTSADATGTASWARLSTQSGGTVIMDVDVGESGATINLNSVNVVATVNVSITSGTLTYPAS